MFADATDERLPSMAPIFAFHHEGVAYAASLQDVEGGKTYTLEDGTEVLLYRRPGASS
jgi:hypothetical protein